MKNRFGVSVFGLICSSAVTLGLSNSGSAREWDSLSSRMNKLPCQEDLPLFKYHPEQGFNAENAYLAMVASWLGHQKPEITVNQLRDWEFNEMSLFTPDRAGQTGYAAKRDGLVLLSFRGTESISDYVLNTAFIQTDNAKIGFPGRGHLGMVTKFGKLKAEILADVRKYRTNQEQVVIVGHSLGGVMAMLAALTLQEEGIPVHLLQTFGQPHFGDSVFNEYAAPRLQEFYHRVEHENDITPHVPPLLTSAQAFSEILPQKMKRMRNGMVRLFNRLEFMPTPGSMRILEDQSGLQLTAEGLETKLDQSYWQRITGDLAGRKDDPDWFSKILENFADHQPSRYICALASTVIANRDVTQN
jgi:pimeloyl-ACP methyl ester carboxylesterase